MLDVQTTGIYFKYISVKMSRILTSYAFIHVTYIALKFKSYYTRYVYVL